MQVLLVICVLIAYAWGASGHLSAIVSCETQLLDGTDKEVFSCRWASSISREARTGPVSEHIASLVKTQLNEESQRAHTKPRVCCSWRDAPKIFSLLCIRYGFKLHEPVPSCHPAPSPHYHSGERVVAQSLQKRSQRGQELLDLLVVVMPFVETDLERFTSRYSDDSLPLNFQHAIQQRLAGPSAYRKRRSKNRRVLFVSVYPTSIKDAAYLNLVAALRSPEFLRVVGTRNVFIHGAGLDDRENVYDQGSFQAMGPTSIWRQVMKQVQSIHFGQQLRVLWIEPDVLLNRNAISRVIDVSSASGAVRRWISGSVYHGDELVDLSPESLRLHVNGVALYQPDSATECHVRPFLSTRGRVVVEDYATEGAHCFSELMAVSQGRFPYIPYDAACYLAMAYGRDKHVFSQSRSMVSYSSGIRYYGKAPVNLEIVRYFHPTSVVHTMYPWMPGFHIDGILHESGDRYEQWLSRLCPISQPRCRQEYVDGPLSPWLSTLNIAHLAKEFLSDSSAPGVKQFMDGIGGAGLENARRMLYMEIIAAPLLTYTSQSVVRWVQHRVRPTSALDHPFVCAHISPRESCRSNLCSSALVTMGFAEKQPHEYLDDKQVHGRLRRILR